MAKTKSIVSGRPSGSVSTASRKVSNSGAKASAKSQPAAQLYSSFLPIPLLLPCPVPITSSSSSSSSSSVVHYIYARVHRDSSPSYTTSGRTVFVSNLPVDMDDRALRGVFTRWGVVESVEIASGSGGGDVLEQAVRGIPVDEDEDDDEEEEEEDEEEGTTPHAEAKFTGPGEKPLPRSKRPRRRPQTLPSSVPDLVALPSFDPRNVPLGLSGLRTSLITYLDSISLTRLFSSSLSPIALDTLSSSPSGLSYYSSLHSLSSPSLSDFRAHADSAMARFDHLHGLLLSSRAKKSGAGALVDEDGFTVVVRSGRYGRTGGRGADGAGVGVATKGFGKSAEEEGKKKGRGAGELPDFYKFQHMDRKRKELADLRAKFDADRRKVEDLKKTRRFRPY